jgi:predicted RNA-binding Zn ribbon-like protein
MSGDQSFAAPADLEGLRSFVNTLDVEEGTDRLGTTSGATAWLAEMGWTDGLNPDERDLGVLRRLREAFRNQLLDHAGHRGDDDATAVITEVGSMGPLVVKADAAGARLAPGGTGVEALLGRLLAAYYSAGVDGSWNRLKACGNDACRWAYYDHSRNGSRRWCTSRGCGNLMAARAYRERQR